MPFNNSSMNLSNQANFIRRHGEFLNYFIGMKCTCTSSMMMTGSNLPDSNRASLSCQACRGLGWVWQSAGQILGVVENINQHRDLLESGVADPGDLVLSPDIRVTLSSYDKIQFTWAEGIPAEVQLITRSSTNTDVTLYGVTSVSTCIVVDPVTGIITNYTPGVDFIYDSTNPTASITWQGGRIPAAGTVYSLKYQALIDWILFTLPQPRLERGTNLGQRVIMRKKHVVAFGV